MTATDTSSERRVKSSKAERLSSLKSEIAAQHEAAAKKQATRGNGIASQGLERWRQNGVIVFVPDERIGVL
jgi:hypothetical protein